MTISESDFENFHAYPYLAHYHTSATTYPDGFLCGPRQFLSIHPMYMYMYTHLG